MKKICAGLIIVLLLCGALTAFSQEASESNLENEAIANAIVGAFTTQTNMGAFQSEDGTTGSLSEEQINELVNEYNEKVDMYFADSHGSHDYYKWLNEYLLRDSLKSTVDNCREGGVFKCTLNEIRYDGENEAEVKGTIVTWNKWIVFDDIYEDGLFHVEYPVGETAIECRMVRENGNWKIKETLQFDPIENENVSEVLTANNADDVFKDSEGIEQLDAQKRETVIHQAYPDYESALEALNSL